MHVCDVVKAYSGSCWSPLSAQDRAKDGYNRTTLLVEGGVDYALGRPWC